MSDRLGIPFVVAAPSGTGKTTICRAVVEADPQIESSISHTTRKPRSGEADGVAYYFVDEATFLELRRRGEFLEHAEYGGNLYGTSSEKLREILEDRGHDVILEIEVQGARQIRERRRDARFIFLLPPTLEELERRLRGRGTDSEEAVARRLAMADRELAAIHFFDYAVINDDLERAISEVREIIEAERAGTQAALDRARDLFGRDVTLERWRARNPGATPT